MDGVEITDAESIASAGALVRGFTRVPASREGWTTIKGQLDAERGTLSDVRTRCLNRAPVLTLPPRLVNSGDRLARKSSLIVAGHS